MNALKVSRAVAALVGGIVLAAGLASAKLPAPPPVDPAKAEEAKKKAAEGAKKEADDLAKAQDRAVERYKKDKGIKTAASKPPPAKK